MDASLVPPADASALTALAQFLQFVHFAWVPPLVVLAARWRFIRSRTTFLAFAFFVSAGIQMLWVSLVAAAEGFIYGYMSVHASTALWQFLYREAPIYVVPWLSLAAIWYLSFQWRPVHNEG